MKHGKLLVEGEFIKDCVMKIVKHTENVYLAWSIITLRVKDVSYDLKRLLGNRGDGFVWSCDENTDVLNTAQLLIFLRGVTNIITNELLNLQRIKGLTRATHLFDSLLSS